MPAKTTTIRIIDRTLEDVTLQLSADIMADALDLLPPTLRQRLEWTRYKRGDVFPIVPTGQLAALESAVLRVTA